MKTLILLIALPYFAFAQYLSEKEIVGVWQKGDSFIAAAYKDTYQFFADGHFIYNFSQFDEIGRIRNLDGWYKLHQDTLYTTIQFRTEKIDGLVRRGYMAYETEWVLDSARFAIVGQPESAEESCSLKILNNGSMMFNKSPYWKISNDPNNYHP
jgi:hypothetical protein